MKRATLVMAALALLLGGVGQARAGILYANGSLNGQNQALQIGNSHQISNSFTLTQTSTLTSVEVGLWVDHGATPTSLVWTISTQPAGNPPPSYVPSASILASGTASGSSLTNTLKISDNSFTSDVYDTDFSLSVTLNPGTYYLSLGPNSTASDSGGIFWDDNNGPSVAYSSTVGNLYGTLGTGSNSEYFEIFGSPNASATPEPASLTLLGIGAICSLGYGWRRR
ncbi:MAG TPA: PEP-CTERM sorting domain-containing protein, partial [Gemmataceae bacterium]|nr:PEP-CTERM sorting domain-containing protein [Gemmataceae bacterium]